MNKTLIKFHYTYLLIALGFVLTGFFLNLIIFTSIIIIHELGHYLAAKYKKFKVKQIVIYPYGGVTYLNDFINKDIDDELLVSVSGLIFQFFYYFIIIILYQNSFIRDYTFNLFSTYHFAIFFFNILPIYPLDGYKILNLLLSKKISFKRSNNIALIISIITLLILLIVNYYKFNYTYILIITTLITNVVLYYKKLEYLFNRFLLERYLYNIKYNDIKIINSKNKMYKNYTHIIKNNGKYVSEFKILKELFDKKSRLW